MQSAAAARGRAPGKVILLGEHAVVYDRPALATSIGRYVDVQVFSGAEARANAAPEVPGPVLARATQLAGLSPCTVRVTTAADLPVGVGLGSSAALSVALVRALADYAGTALDAAGVCARAFELEKLFHGFPSGIDNTVCAVGGLLRFQRGQHVAPVHARRPLVLVVAVGCAARATHAAVTALRRRWQVDRRGYEAIFDEIAALVDAAEVAVSGGDLHELGRLMNDNHRLLHRIGVSTEELERMVTLARTHGALGAKLTGGGGGGAIICLCPDDPARLVAAFAAAGWDAFVTETDARERGIHAIDRNDVEGRSARL